MASAPAPAADIGSKLIGIATELTQLLERETTLVRTLKIGEIGSLQKDKTRLTKLLQEALKQLKAGKPLPPAIKVKWQEAGRRLAEAVIANERALRVGRLATERLVATVVKAVTDTRRPFRTYAPPRRRVLQKELAGIAVDRRL
jgi:hypothetical protein